MRLPIEIVIVAALIYLGWNSPFKEWAVKGNVMSSREPFTAPERSYRPRDNLRTAPLPRVSSLPRGAVGAGMVVTPEGVYRLECRNVCTVVVVRSLHSLNGLSHPKEISVPIITISTNNRISKGEVHKTS